jgi:DNA (cytosine-5)-methyltransferase 1
MDCGEVRVMNILTLPSMEEISQVKPNGYKAISLFAGAGGSSLGYRMAGFKVLLANEFIPAAQQVYKDNHPETIVNTKDIRELSAQEVLDLVGLKVGELDVLDGSPPCAQFSALNNVNKTKLGEKIEYSGIMQRVDDLFFEYVRLLREIRPKVFIAENVKGLRQGQSKPIYEKVLQEFADSGYKVDCRLLNAADYGVPQRRNRLIFMGIRDDLNMYPSYPEPLSQRYTARDALPYLISAEEDTGGQFSYGEFIDTQCPTIRASGRGQLYAVDKTNPSVRRKMTIEEVKRLSSFPEDFQLNVSQTKAHERIGRAVPPLMM